MIVTRRSFLQSLALVCGLGPALLGEFFHERKKERPKPVEVTYTPGGTLYQLKMGEAAKAGDLLEISKYGVVQKAHVHSTGRLVIAMENSDRTGFITTTTKMTYHG